MPSIHERPAVVGTGAGITHLALSMVLWESFGFMSPAKTFAVDPLFGTYTVAGMFLLGAVPGALFARYRSLAPAVVVGSLLAVSAAWTRRTTASGATPVDPTPFGWYLLLWVVVVALAALSGWIERRLRGTDVDVKPRANG